MTEITRHTASKTNDHGYDDQTIATLYSFIRAAFDSIDVFWWGRNNSLGGFKRQVLADYGWTSCGSVARAVIDCYIDSEILTENEIDTLYRAADKWDSLDRAGRDRLTIERLSYELARETDYHRTACDDLKTATARTERAYHHLGKAKDDRDNWKASSQSYRRQMLALRAGDIEGFKAEQRDRLRAIADEEASKTKEFHVLMNEDQVHRLMNDLAWEPTFTGADDIHPWSSECDGAPLFRASDVVAWLEG